MDWRRQVGAIGVVASLAWSGCGGAAVFACDADGQCGAGGQCEPEGFCSFPDDGCASGYSFGSHAGGGLAGQCTSPASTGSTNGTALVTGSGEGSAGMTSSPTSATTSIGAVDSSTSDAGDSSSSGGSDTGTPVDPDLVLWVRMNDPPDDGAEDSSTYGHAVECAICPATTPGPSSQAYAFDVASYFTVAHVPQFETTEAFTVAAWARYPAVPSVLNTVAAKAVGDASLNSWELFVRETMACGPCVFFGSGSVAAGAQFATAPAPPADTWIHLAGTWDGTQIALWIDGELVDVDVVDVGFDESPITIGTDLDAGALNGEFNGDIDDVRLYARALSADEIAVVMAERG